MHDGAIFQRHAAAICQDRPGVAQLEGHAKNVVRAKGIAARRVDVRLRGHFCAVGKFLRLLAIVNHDTLCTVHLPIDPHFRRGMQKVFVILHSRFLHLPVGLITQNRFAELNRARLHPRLPAAGVCDRFLDQLFGRDFLRVRQRSGQQQGKQEKFSHNQCWWTQSAGLPVCRHSQFGSLHS